MWRVASRKILGVTLLALTAAAPTTQSDQARFYLSKASHEAWGVVDADQQILLSAMIVGLQIRAGDLDGLHDSKTRITVALRKEVGPASVVLGNASLARINIAQGNREEYEKNLKLAQEAAAKVTPTEQPVALLAVMAAQVKGGHFDAARATADSLHTASAAMIPQIAWLFRDSHAGKELVPLLKKWSNDPAKLLGWMIQAGALDAAEEITSKISNVGARAQGLADIAVARWQAGEREAYAKDVQGVIGLKPPALVLAKFALAQAKLGDKDGAVSTARAASRAELGLDPIAPLMNIALAQYKIGDMDGFAASMAKAQTLADQASDGEKAAALYRIARIRAEADQIQPAIDTINEAEKAGEDTFGYRADALAALAVAQLRAGKIEEAEKQAFLVKEPTQRDKIREAIGLELAEEGKLDDSWTALARLSDPRVRVQMFRKTLPIAAKTADPETIDKIVKEFGGGAPAERAALYVEIARGVLQVGE